MIGMKSTSRTPEMWRRNACTTAAMYFSYVPLRSKPSAVHSLVELARLFGEQPRADHRIDAFDEQARSEDGPVDVEDGNLALAKRASRRASHARPPLAWPTLRPNSTTTKVGSPPRPSPARTEIVDIMSSSEYRAAMTSLRGVLTTRELVVLDFETTGLTPAFDRTIEVAATLLVNHRPVETFHQLMHPGVRLPSFITSLTGITDDR
jgi:hypothetical protein